MYPVLLKFWKVTIFSYGVLIAIGFIIAIIYASRCARKAGIPSEKITDLGLYCMVGGIAGARILYVLLHIDEYKVEPLRILRIWEGGLVFYGGFAVAMVIGMLYLRRQKLPLWRTADVVVPAIALGHSIGRWACFSAGCCYGRQTTLPWAVTFTNPQSLARLNTPLHPSQIYESIIVLFIFFILLILRRRKKFDGELFWVYVLAYSFARFFLEFLRGDPREFPFGGFLSSGQIESIIGFILSILVMIYLKKKYPVR